MHYYSYMGILQLCSTTSDYCSITLLRDLGAQPLPVPLYRSDILLFIVIVFHYIPDFVPPEWAALWSALVNIPCISTLLKLQLRDT